MVRQQSIGTTPGQVQGNDCVTATLYWTNPGFASRKQHYKLDNIRTAPTSACRQQDDLVRSRCKYREVFCV